MSYMPIVIPIILIVARSFMSLYGNAESGLYKFVDFIGTGGKDGSGQKKTLKGVEYPFKIKRKKADATDFNISRINLIFNNYSLFYL